MISISTCRNAVTSWVWCTLINSCGRFLDGLVSWQFLKESYPSISTIDCKNQPSSHECWCCFTTIERMAGTSIKFCFRFCHADIKAGRFLHCHHHRWRWLASHHAELVIGTNSASKRERWYVTKWKTPSAELVRLSSICVLLLATHCERDFRIHPRSVYGNPRLLTMLKRFLAFWWGWNYRHRRTSTGRDRHEQFTFSWQFYPTGNNWRTFCNLWCCCIYANRSKYRGAWCSCHGS